MAASRPEATSPDTIRPARAAFMLGFAFAVNTAAGSAVLLYTGQGFLRAAGVLFGTTIGALTAGLWVGAVPGTRLRPRWAVTLILYLLAAVVVALWTTRPALRAFPLGDAVAMLLILALPAYATGLLLAAIAEGAGRRAGLAAMAGAALATVIAASTLIPRLDAPIVFALTATLVLFAMLADWRRAHPGGGTMPGDVIIISGAAHRGQLAFSLAQHLAADGARLVLTGRSDGVHHLAAELAAEGRTAVAVQADLLDEADTARVVQTAREHFGRIDAIVNAAGGLAHIGSVEDTGPDALRAELDRNLATALNLTRAALPALRETRGAIVYFASPAALRAPATLAAYSAAKAGLVALTRSLAIEERDHGVRVNAIAPGIMDTDQNRATSGENTRFVPRDEVAEVVSFLVSRRSRGVTGEVIQVLSGTIR